ncbi:HAMP domain-containing histidine kinase [Paenibacillus antri]|uniref:histidine kinase n=1 Tax=Paenibacillus antri TaxID=2582848 RepID=A0A5R9G4C4_9BACL|nr:sensor histidine kinase [Paenibacillus antri]TLS49186.1 HAMP domain-containing histidine kinase [Paenibacillus antri]
MRLNHFLADRLGYIVLFLLNTLLAVLVVQLDLARQGASLLLGNVAYLIVLSACGLAAFLLYDYARNRAYYRELEAASREEGGLERALLVRSRGTTEQRLVREALERAYRTYADALSRSTRAQERQLHQLQQWAHQMKTPIAVIDLLAQSEEERGGERPEAMASVREEAERLNGYVSMMLEAARLERFETDVRVRRVDAASIARGAINEYRSAWIRYGVFPRLAAEEAPYWVETDEKWASFVCKQLLGNALKYSAAAGGTRVEVRLARTPEGVRLEVADEGIGIPPEDMPRVFEPFFTGANGRLVAESTGMGLYVAKEACDRLGHRLSISSSPGAGTTATVLFADTGALFREPLGR